MRFPLPVVSGWRKYLDPLGALWRMFQQLEADGASVIAGLVTTIHLRIEKNGAATLKIGQSRKSSLFSTQAITTP